MKTPLEELAEAKRSGKFHPETEKNWPTEDAKEKAKEVMADSKVLDPEQDRPAPKISVPKHTTFEPPYASNSAFREHVEEQFYWNAGFLLAILSILAILVLMNADKIDGKRPAPKSKEISKPFKEAPPKVIKKVVKVPTVKKVYIAEENNAWRRKLCYAYGDWNACLAYKKDLPSRARVGRTDL